MSIKMSSKNIFGFWTHILNTYVLNANITYLVPLNETSWSWAHLKRKLMFLVRFLFVNFPTSVQFSRRVVNTQNYWACNLLWSPKSITMFWVIYKHVFLESIGLITWTIILPSVSNPVFCFVFDSEQVNDIWPCIFWANIGQALKRWGWILWVKQVVITFWV